MWSATRRVFGAASYIVARLTGEYVLDHHSAGHWAPLYDVRRNAWIDEWADRVAPGLPLPRLVWPQEACGTVSRAAAAATGLVEGTPVAGGSIDSWAEVTASGLRGPGRGCWSTGPACSSSRSPAPRIRMRGSGARWASCRGRATSPRSGLGRGARGMAARADRRHARTTSCTRRPPAPGPAPAASSPCPTSPANARRCSTPTCAARSSG